MQYDYSKLPRWYIGKVWFNFINICVSFILFCVVIVDGAKVWGPDSPTYEYVCLMGVPWALIFWCMAASSWRVKLRRRRVAQFARLNHLKDVHRTRHLSDIPPMLKHYGSVEWVDRVFPQCYAFEVPGARVGVYEVVLQWAADSRFSTDRSYWVLQFDLPSEFPHIYLNGDNKVRGVYKASQRVSLEGDFDKYFKLYLPDNEAVDVLSIITPDVMQALVREGRPYDIEIVGQKVFICSGENLFQRRVLPHALAFAGRLAAELNHRSASWQDELPGQSPAKQRLRTRLTMQDLGFALSIVAAVGVALYGWGYLLLLIAGWLLGRNLV